MRPPNRKQFTAARTPDHAFPSAEVAHVGPWIVHRSPDLPVHRLSLDGQAALVLGWPTHLGHRAELTRAELGELGGSWVAMTEREVIPDPLGSYATVYSPDGEVVASTTAMLAGHRLVARESLNALLDLPRSRNWYPFGLTPYVNAHRLLPNHVLDLVSWTTRRVNTPRPALPVDDAITTIADNLRRNITTVGAQHPLMLGVTAGNETRMLLAGLRGVPDVYGYTFGTVRSMDTVTGARLGRATGITHEIRPNAYDPDVSARWFHDVGGIVTGQTMRNAAGKELLPEDRAQIKGMGGEIGRGVYYRTHTPAVDTAADLVTALFLPAHPDLSAAAQAWLDRLEPTDVPDLLDSLYFDNRLGGWSAPQRHADTRVLMVSYPLNYASTIAAMRSLPLPVKRDRQMSPLVVRRLWPELLDIPINSQLPVARAKNAARTWAKSALRAVRR